MSIDRRKFIASAAVAPIGGVALAENTDPHPTWLNRWREVRDWINTSYPDEDDPVWDEFYGTEDKLFYTKAKTPEGVSAQLDFIIADDIELNSKYEGHVALVQNMRASLREMAGVTS